MLVIQRDELFKEGYEIPATDAKTGKDSYIVIDEPVKAEWRDIDDDKGNVTVFIGQNTFIVNSIDLCFLD